MFWILAKGGICSIAGTPHFRDTPSDLRCRWRYCQSKFEKPTPIQAGRSQRWKTCLAETLWSLCVSIWQNHNGTMHYCNTYNDTNHVFCWYIHNGKEPTWIYYLIPTQVPLSLAIRMCGWAHWALPKKPFPPSRLAPGLWSCSYWAAMISPISPLPQPSPGHHPSKFWALRRSDVCGIAKPLCSSLVLYGSNLPVRCQ